MADTHGGRMADPQPGQPRPCAPEHAPWGLQRAPGGQAEPTRKRRECPQLECGSAGGPSVSKGLLCPGALGTVPDEELELRPEHKCTENGVQERGPSPPANGSWGAGVPGHRGEQGPPLRGGTCQRARPLPSVSGGVTPSPWSRQTHAPLAAHPVETADPGFPRAPSNTHTRFQGTKRDIR